MSENSLVGQVVEQRYRIEAPIGRGAMGAVFRARHVKLGCEVAVKVLHDHLVRDPGMVARFEREAAISSRLRHRNLVNVIDIGETPAHQRMMVLELVHGESLASIVRGAPLAPERVINLVKQLLDGLEHAHAAELVHRDLKPDNVIVEVDLAGVEIPRIVDFGIAVLCGHGDRSVAGRRITGTGFVLGTPAYMAPEQAQGDAPDPRADLFALGVMTYEMLAGVQPFDGDGDEVIMSNLSKDPPPIHRRAPGVAVDPLLEAFARRLMARNLHQRFASARAALDLLALIERDRAAAAAELGIVTEMDLVDTMPARRPCATAALPRPVWMPPVLPGRPPAAALPPALQTSKVPPGFPVRPMPPMPPAPQTAPARSTPRLFGLAGSSAWLGCVVFLAGGLLAFALVAG